MTVTAWDPDTHTVTGVVHGMPDHFYHARTELSSTGARRILDSPARFQYEQTHRTESRAFDVGHAVHAKILGTGVPVVTYPDEHLTPSGNPSTKAATKEWEGEQRAKGLAPISRADARLIDAMAEAVLTHKGARAILERPGNPEVSAFATDPDTGVQCRARFDRFGDGLGVDLKTTAGSASAHGFGKDAAKHGYPIQDAHYTDVMAWLTGEIAPMAFVVVEKRAPHLVAVHYFDDITRLVARELAAKARRTYAECLEADTWPGYSDEPYTTQVPGWWLDQADDDNDEMVI